jgi:hypothetical protein
MRSKIALIAFCRMNPPTIGHLKMVKLMNETSKQLTADPFIYLSHSYDGIDSKKPQNQKSKNPLKYEDKLLFCKEAFGDLAKVVKSSAVNIFFVLHQIWEQNYEKAIIFGGEDRADEFKERVAVYNNRGDPHDQRFFAFEELPTVINAGKRDESSSDIAEQASASLLRKFVNQNDLTSFKKYAATTTSTDSMFYLLRTEMGYES